MSFRTVFNTKVVNPISKTSIRSIYLHKGPRINGLKRDPEQVFTNEQGQQYDNINENIKYIQEFLQDKYKITNELALQVITHKSFANGIKPYNEKLSAMGSKILNLHLGKLVIESNTQNQLAIENKNLDILGQPIAKELTGRLSLGIFAKVNKLNSIMFWNSYNAQGLSFETSGELKVSAQMIYALIGAINYTYGKAATELFINEKIFPAIEPITQQIIESESLDTPEKPTNYL